MDLLISSGADQNSMDKSGKTASQVMKNKGKCCPVTRENQSEMLMTSFFSKKNRKYQLRRVNYEKKRWQSA